MKATELEVETAHTSGPIANDRLGRATAELLEDGGLAGIGPAHEEDPETCGLGNITGSGSAGVIGGWWLARTTTAERRAHFVFVGLLSEGL